MPLVVYNSLSGRKEHFALPAGAEVKLFVCGPTVYDYVHLGHARTYLAFDMIARYLGYLGYHVRYLMNITDVAERVVQRAEKLNHEPLELARQYEAAFLEDMQNLGIRSIERYERASDHIPEMIGQVEGLIQKGVAYETETGVYFEVKKFPKFGELSGQSYEELGLRRLELCSSKKNPEDFSLWRKYEKGLAWNSPWGLGRPGWHIEDTAISMPRLGDTYDIHGGASELVFPHHEAEIAQAEALTGKAPFVRYWFHTGLLKVGGRKMSKSLGNVIRIRDALKEYSAQELRFYFASFHYRQPIILSESGLKRSVRELAKAKKALQTFLTSEESPKSKDETKLQILLNKSEAAFRRHMDDDFDTSRALAVLTTLMRRLSGLKVSQEAKDRTNVAVQKIAGVVGIVG